MDLKIEIYKWIKDYAETNKINQLVVGVSGGDGAMGASSASSESKDARSSSEMVVAKLVVVPLD